MDSNFPKAIAFVLQSEGGYSNDPKDPGGATNLGITQRELTVYNNRHSIPNYNVKNINKIQALKIYYENYWYAAHCNGLPDKLDICMFDTAVNMGVGTSIEFLCSCLSVESSVIFTPELSRAVHAIKPENINKIVDDYLDLRRVRYHSIVARRPASNKFLRGWLNRVDALEKLIK